MTRIIPVAGPAHCFLNSVGFFVFSNLGKADGQFGVLWQSPGQLVFRYGHVHRSAVHLNGIDLIAVRVDSIVPRVAHLQVSALGALQSRHEFRLADLAGGIHGNRSVHYRQKSGG